MSPARDPSPGVPRCGDSTPSLPHLADHSLATGLAFLSPVFGGACTGPQWWGEALQVQQPRGSQVWPVGSSSLTRDGTGGPCIRAWSLRAGPQGRPFRSGSWLARFRHQPSRPGFFPSPSSASTPPRLPVSCPNRPRLNIHPPVPPPRPPVARAGPLPTRGILRARLIHLAAPLCMLISFTGGGSGGPERPRSRAPRPAPRAPRLTQARSDGAPSPRGRPLPPRAPAGLL